MSKGSGNGRSLVIVESPAKAKTINKYLGDEYVVKASLGHVRDLPERTFGVDVSDDFKATYEVVRGRTRVITELRKLASSAPQVFLATDLDREGEAIAWHLAEALKLPPEKTKRVIFNEITRSAIRDAFSHPHEIDHDRVNAQQARRILDRIVGYELSPLLWRKIAKGLSAGRVQSVAVRLIVDREREIRAFVPEESWKLIAYLTPARDAAPGLHQQWHAFANDERTQKEIQEWLGQNDCFRAELTELGGQPFQARDVAAAQAAAEALGFRVETTRREAWSEYAHLKLEKAALVGRLDLAAASPLRVESLTRKRTTTRPPAPFTTASLQQQASTVMRFSASRTMRTAQALYEGIDLNGEGPVGLITYMRTDSTNLSRESIDAVRTFIGQSFGQQYVPDKPNVFGKRQERAQEAHEAIRPTDPHRTPESVRSALSADQFKLYQLIWKRFVACQMPPAQWDSTSVTAICETRLGPAKFTGGGRKLVFDGFMKVAGVSSEDQLLPELHEQQPLAAFGLEPRQQFTSPPAPFTEASLVRALESEGIGRPSTYATIIDTIQSRGYVEQEDRKFYPTALGELVTDKLVAHFPKIMDVKFTSHMEGELDKIEEAHLDWVTVLHEFYDPFRELLGRAGDEMDAVRREESEHKCPTCDAPMVYRWSKTGRFLACSNYPRCKATVNVDREGRPLRPKTTEHVCPECGKPMILRHSRGGYFLGCSGYPECRQTLACDEHGTPFQVVPEEELTQPCDACGTGTLRVKWKGRRAFLACDQYPTCKNIGSIPAGVQVRKKPAPPPEDTGVKCDRCGRPMVVRTGRRGKFISCSGFPKCRNAKPYEKLGELRAAAAHKPADAPTEDAESPAGDKRPSSHTAPARSSDPNAPPPGFAWTRTGRPVVEEMPTADLLCPECGSRMELKRGRFGPFFSCTGFPKCRFVANLRGDAKKQAEEMLPAPQRPKAEPTDILCEECGKPMVIRTGRRGKFLGCSGYPKCQTTRELPAGVGAGSKD